MLKGEACHWVGPRILLPDPMVFIPGILVIMNRLVCIVRQIVIGSGGAYIKHGGEGCFLFVVDCLGELLNN